MDYAAGQYSLSAIDTPSSGRALALSEQGDFLALSVGFTQDDVISVVLDMDGDLPEKIIGGRVAQACMERAEQDLINAAVRLLSILDDPVQLAYMGRHIKREMIFQALCGSCGRQLLQSMLSIQTAEEIYAANSWIKRNFRRAFSVEELAEQQNMSVSGFHQKFKRAVGMGPLQCQKRLRLTEGRRPAQPDDAPRRFYFASASNTDTTYSAISQSCSAVPPPTPMPPAIRPAWNRGQPPATRVILGSLAWMAKREPPSAYGNAEWTACAAV